MECCDRKIANLEALESRSYASLAVGILLIIPFFENLLLHGISPLCGPLLFLLLTAFVWLDFPKQRAFFIQTIIGMGFVLLTPYFISQTLAVGLMLGGVLTLAAGLFLKRAPSIQELKAFDFKEFTKLPSSDDVVIFIAAMAVFISAMHVFLPGLAIGHFMLHEAFIAIGAVNLSLYHQQKLQSGLQDHNFTDFYQQTDSTKTLLVEGTVFNFKKKVQVPVELCATSDCQIITDETVRIIHSGETIPKGAYVSSGKAKLLNDLSRAHHPGIDRKDGINVRLLFGFLFMAAILVSIVKGVLGHSLLMGIEHFIANAAILCPCVFLICGPLLYNSLQRWAESVKIDSSQKIPSASQIDIVVFDRTNTLYHEVEGETHYQLHRDAKTLLGKLKAAGKEIYILSGHHEEALARENLEICKDDLAGIVKPENILFSSEYHQDHNLEGKAKWIAHRQKMGKKVCMIGDGENDAQALALADLGIAVHNGSCLPDVLNSANFSGRVDHVIQHTASLVSCSERVSKAIWWFNFAAFSYHVFMLTMVNGGYFMLFSASFPETLGVIAMSVFCVAAQLTASLVSTNLGGTVVKSVRKLDAPSSTSFGEKKKCCDRDQCGLFRRRDAAQLTAGLVSANLGGEGASGQELGAADEGYSGPICNHCKQFDLSNYVKNQQAVIKAN